jgi:hypothetical protein
MYEVSLLKVEVAQSVLSLGYGVYDRRIRVAFHVGCIFLFSTASIPILWPNQIQFLSVWGALPQGVKLPRREGNYSPPSCSEVKYTYSPLIRLKSECN